MTNNPYAVQHGGSHYVNMTMQPFHFAMVNGWDAGAFSILKYLSRHRSKNGIEDLKKARHFVDLRIAETDHMLQGLQHISMSTYLHKNQIGGRDATALVLLDEWVTHESRLALEQLIKVTGDLMREYQPTPLL